MKVADARLNRLRRLVWWLDEGIRVPGTRIADVFDWAWKSNRRNLQLLERHSVEPLKAKREDRLIVVSLLSLLVAICFGLLFAFAMLAAAVVRVFTGL